MNLTAAPDIDLRTLPEIARDRSPAGRAKLFAFLARLLVARWERLSPGERTQLAELIAVLWPHGAVVDRHQLATHFAGRADIPSALQGLPELAQGTPQAPPISTSLTPTLPVPSPPQNKHIRITVTQRPVVIRRKQADPSAEALAAIPLETGPIRPDHESEQPAATGRLEEKSAEKILRAEEQAEQVAVPSLAPEQPGFPIDAGTEDGRPGSPSPADAAADIDSGSTSPTPSVPVQVPLLPKTPPHPAAVLSRESAVAEYDALLESTLLHAAPEIPAGRVVTEDEVTILAPRDNPHRLTIELLGEALTAGDQARFEVMMASLAGLRSSLLRRLLRDGSDEAFAILARSIGMDEASFAAQWRDWQKNQAELGRAPRPIDGARLKRGSAFFRSLTEQQTDRLVRGWRGRAGRIFSAPRTSS